MLQVQIAISGQYAENYGAENWDGEGVCPQHWKYKDSYEQLMVCNVNLTDMPAVIAEIRERMAEMSWSSNYSSCYFNDVIVMPNKLQSRDFSAFEYGFYEEITSVSHEEIQEFLRCFGKNKSVDPAPFKYDDVVA